MPPVLHNQFHCLCALRKVRDAWRGLIMPVIALGLLGEVCWGTHARAHTPEAPASYWPLGPVALQNVVLHPDVRSLQQRLMAEMGARDTAEPLMIRPKKQKRETSAWEIVRALAKEPDLIPWPRPEALPKGPIRLGAADLKWLDLERLRQALGHNSVMPLVEKNRWEEAAHRPWTREGELLWEHFSSFWSIQRTRIEFATSGSGYVRHPLERTVPTGFIPPTAFLPAAVADRWGAYAPTRGLNCFATALGFFDFDVVFDKSINSVREPGHDLGLINHDEFLQALWLGYQELSEADALAGLKWGDIVAFYDEAEGNGFSSIKHAAVHIADTVYFHKASKSSSSPVEFTTWQQLVDTWSKYTRKLNYRVFRKLPMTSTPYLRPAVAIEKILWSSK